jgi:hypothetical protein
VAVGLETGGGLRLPRCTSLFYAVDLFSQRPP